MKSTRQKSRNFTWNNTIQTFISPEAQERPLLLRSLAPTRKKVRQLQSTFTQLQEMKRNPYPGRSTGCCKRNGPGLNMARPGNLTWQCTANRRKFRLNSLNLAPLLLLNPVDSTQPQLHHIGHSFLLITYSALYAQLNSKPAIAQNEDLWRFFSSASFFNPIRANAFYESFLMSDELTDSID